MKKVKTVLLILVVIVLMASTIYLAITIQEESNKTGAINTRASDDDENSRQLAYQTTSPGPSPSSVPGASVTPTGYRSTTGTPPPTSKSPTPTKAISPTGGTTKGGLPLNSPTPTSKPYSAPTYTPGPPQELPVAGIADHWMKIMGGAGMLIVIAFLL